MKYTNMTIGVPREIMTGERRVAAIPDTVKQFVEAGARVLVEKGAGVSAFYPDEDYVKAGAELVESPAELYSRSDLVLKVKEPRVNESTGEHEVSLMCPGTVLVCFLHPASPSNHATVKLLAENRVTSFTLDGVPRISRAQQMDALTSMSTVAGYKAALIGANHLARFVPMIPMASGVIQPAGVLVVGTGVAGLQAAATARRLGARLKTLDIRPEANEQAGSLGAEIVPFDLPEGMGVGKGGYAQRLSEEWYAREREVLSGVIEVTDLVILTALLPGERAPVLVTGEMVGRMRPGSVIVDVSIDQGGNCALTRPAEEYTHQGVMISGLANIPATLAADSTRMFAQSACHFVHHIVNDGAVDELSEDPIIRETLVTRDGRIVHQGTLRAMDEGDRP